MYERAKALYMSRLRVVTKWDDLVPTLDNKCVAVLPWCEVEECEDDIKERSAKAYVSLYVNIFPNSLIYHPCC